MNEKILPLTVSLLILTLTGCSLIPSSGAPSTPTPSNHSIPPSGYEPQPDDSKLKRDKVFLDLENSSLLIMESYPVQVSTILNGNMSDPCHKLRLIIIPADEQKQIMLEVYSVFDPNVACITVIQPFTATIPLGNYAGGHFKVYVNGELLGEFDA